MGASKGVEGGGRGGGANKKRTVDSPEKRNSPENRWKGETSPPRGQEKIGPNLVPEPLVTNPPVFKRKRGGHFYKHSNRLKRSTEEKGENERGQRQRKKSLRQRWGGETAGDSGEKGVPRIMTKGRLRACSQPIDDQMGKEKLTGNLGVKLRLAKKGTRCISEKPGGGEQPNSVGGNQAAGKPNHSGQKNMLN